MYYGKADVNTFERGASREFLVSNGKGGYAFSTVIGANTRKEHGLLVVPGERTSTPTVYVSKVEETLFARNKNISYQQINIKKPYILMVIGIYRNMKKAPFLQRYMSFIT